MGGLAEALGSGRFVVTTEMTPPKGTDLTSLVRRAKQMAPAVDAYNLTDCHTSRMTMSPLAAAHMLIDRGLEPILQLTCRDRNRIALQSDLLSAHSLGVTNVLCMTGDPIDAGDHPDARPVFDLDSVGLLRAVASLQSGEDMSGAELKGAPSFHVGAVVDPGAPDPDRELRRMEQKIEAGAVFFQTQAVYELAALEKFMSTASGFGVPIIAGVIMLRSAGMARRLNAAVPGVFVPDEAIRQMEMAGDPGAKSVEIATRIIEGIKSMCQGVHIIGPGWESRMLQALAMAGLAGSR